MTDISKLIPNLTMGRYRIIQSKDHYSPDLLDRETVPIHGISIEYDAPQDFALEIGLGRLFQKGWTLQEGVVRVFKIR